MTIPRVWRALLASMVAICLAGGGLLSLAGPAAADPVTVTGTVTTSAGTVTGWTSVQFYDDEQGLAEAVSTNTGVYSLNLEPGTYDVTIEGDATTGGVSTHFLNLQGPVVIGGPRTQDFQVAAQPIQINLTDAQGSPVAGSVMLRCTNARFNWTPQQLWSEGTTSPGQPVTLWGSGYPVEDGAEPPCLVGATRNDGDGSTYYERVDVDVDTDEITIVIPDSVTLSGSLDEVAVARGSRIASVSVETQEGDPVTFLRFNADAEYEIQVPPGSYDVEFDVNNDRGGYNSWHSVDVVGDTTYDLIDESVPMTVHLLGAGDSVEWYVTLSCFGSGGGPNFRYPEGRTEHLGSQGSGESQGGTQDVSLIGRPDGQVESCTLNADSEAGSYSASQVPGILPTPDVHLTWNLTEDRVLVGTPGVSVDDDGVLDTVESQGPNNGDGNNDGVPDHEQNHVTSLPTNGDDPGGESSYMTIAGPVGSKLSNVSTMDPADAVTPPPAGVTLPAGLVSFALTGIEPGSDQTITYYFNAPEEARGYAKYDPGTGTWTMLPPERVVLNENWALEVTLTDGGVGDADGVANGTIVDPGGPAILPTGDTSPPEVTGRVTTRPNGNGWYRGNVRIDWTATDPSGVKRQPADTTVTTEGSDVTAQSPIVCDKAPTPNCGRGALSGLKIDKTAPSLSITGVSNGATYTLGNVPTASCSASDPLSGLAAPCKGVRSGGNANGVGQFTYAASVADKAGNVRLVTSTYRVVYRFDGFLAPLNNTGPTSIFKAGSTVPAAFAVKRANGQVVTPVSKPTWVSPSRGSRTSLPVNEAVSTAKGTSGSSFVWKNGRWQYDWSTKGVSAGYLYRIGVRLDDGTTHYLTVGVR